MLRRDESGPEPWLFVCVACGREADPPPIMPVDKWPGGVQPAIYVPKPRYGNHRAKPPSPDHVWRETFTPSQWRRLMATKEAVRRPAVGPKSKGKTYVAPLDGLNV